MKAHKISLAALFVALGMGTGCNIVLDIDNEYVAGDGGGPVNVSSGQGGAGGMTGSGGAGGMVGSGGAGGGTSEACAPSETADCYSGDPSTKGVGVCATGTKTCNDNGEWGPCEGDTTPGTEVCDGVDNDCDGTIDNGCPCSPGQQESCYSGATDTKGVGECHEGTRTCDATGNWGPCEGEVVPVSESCDGKDNNCNGQVDDGNPGGGSMCNTNKPGVCSAGTKYCQGGAIVCVSNVQSSTEVCDGVDNDCDGSTDEGLGVGSSCSVGVGACAKSGSIVCNGMGGVKCSATPGSASTEVCDGVDNDCDGSTDEGLGLGVACSVGTGACARSGTKICDGMGGIKCSATPGPASTEVCDGIDNDCNGTVDDGLGLGDACSVGTGACARSGTKICDGMGGIKCSATPGPTSTEVCDGVDNDCDGAVDESFPNNGAWCNTGEFGQCADGYITCKNGYLDCQMEVGPTAEICNDDIDNDCDGDVDEGQQCCFGAGTPIAMADGTKKAIEDVVVGDMVLAYDMESMRVVPTPVVKAFVHETTTDDVLIVNGNLHVTANHQVYANGRWVRADGLNIGDELVLLKNEGSPFMSVSPSSTFVNSIVTQDDRPTTYNIEVAYPYNYFAGGILVNIKQLP